MYIITNISGKSFSLGNPESFQNLFLPYIKVIMELNFEDPIIKVRNEVDKFSAMFCKLKSAPVSVEEMKKTMPINRKSKNG